ncbi:unnamed protein product [Protopolystoma xenopodis]|uniref:Uncharacterized protein n=1 Tax=Protopolystoma xenopodis TaxID=117903 RepID=A0A448X7S3_9PLAT|nr:unnamed protein product [Protopolystoma xenopodis]
MPHLLPQTQFVPQTLLHLPASGLSTPPFSGLPSPTGPTTVSSTTPAALGGCSLQFSIQSPHQVILSPPQQQRQQHLTYLTQSPTGVHLVGLPGSLSLPNSASLSSSMNPATAIGNNTILIPRQHFETFIDLTEPSQTGDTALGTSAPSDGLLEPVPASNQVSTVNVFPDFYTPKRGSSCFCFPSLSSHLFVIFLFIL